MQNYSGSCESRRASFFVVNFVVALDLFLCIPSIRYRVASTNSGLLLKVVPRLTLCAAWIVAAGLTVQTMCATQPLCPVKVSEPLPVSESVHMILMLRAASFSPALL
mgnify:CR=1 FL=1